MLASHADHCEDRTGVTALGFLVDTAIGSVVNVHRITPLEIIGRDVIPAAAKCRQEHRDGPGRRRREGG